MSKAFKTSPELQTFLKILAEESALRAMTLAAEEEKRAQDDIAHRIKKTRRIVSKDKEALEEDEEEGEEKSDEPDTDTDPGGPEGSPSSGEGEDLPDMDGEGEDDDLFGGAGGGGGGAPVGGGGGGGLFDDEPSSGDGRPAAAADSGDASSDPEDVKPRGQPIRDVSPVIKLTIKDLEYSLNTIRSGKSLKDPDTREGVKSYYDTLSSAEKMAIHKYFRALAQVIVGGVPGEDAVEPEDEPGAVRIEPVASDKEVSPGSGTGQGGSIEDTTPPVRVVPGTSEAHVRSTIKDLLDKSNKSRVL